MHIPLCLFVCAFVCVVALRVCVCLCLLVGGSDGDGAYMVLIIKNNLDSKHSEPLRQLKLQYSIIILSSRNKLGSSALSEKPM